jgi:hypothetical protein
MTLAILDLKTRPRKRLVGLQTTYTKLVGEVMRRTVQHWHREIFPRHFGARNRSKYNFAPRSRLYTEKIKRFEGQAEGKFRDLVLKGWSKFMLTNMEQITGTAKRLTVRMHAPFYFDKPFVGTWVNPKTGKRKTITRQPDKVAEVTRFDAEDFEDIRAFAAARLQNALDLNDRLS